MDDSSTTEDLLDKTYTEAKVVLNRIERSIDDWVYDGCGVRSIDRRRSNNSTIENEVVAQLTTQMAIMTSFLQTMALNNGAMDGNVNQVNVLNLETTPSCVGCSESHPYEMCHKILNQSPTCETTTI